MLNIKPTLRERTLLAGKHIAQIRALVELLTHRCRSSIWTCYDLGACSQCGVLYEMHTVSLCYTHGH